MTLQEFHEINWHRGNVAKLNNGKEYLVKGTKGQGRWLLLYSEEFEKCFVADHNIVVCRTSDYEEPEEIYLEKKRKHQEEATAKREAERLAYLQAKAERKQRNLQEQERIHQEALARKAAKAKNQPMTQKVETKSQAEQKPAPQKQKPTIAEPVAATKPAITSDSAPEQPKRKRQRIRIKRTDKVEFK